MPTTWLGNPGRPCCGDDETPCDARICLTVAGGEAEVPLEGAEVDGGSLGTCTTDAGGVCCFDVTSDGTYSFAVTRDGFSGGSVEVVVLDCGDEDAEVNLPAVVQTGPICVVIQVEGCNCPLPGAAVTISGTYLGVAWTRTAIVTNLDGRVVLCYPGTDAVDGSIAYHVSAPTFEARTAPSTSAGGILIFQLRTTDYHAKWCWGATPPAPPRCREMMPTSVSVTFSGAWPAALPGSTHTFLLEVADPGGYWRLPCQATPGSPSFAAETMEAFFHAHDGPAGPCTTPISADATVTFSHACDLPAIVLPLTLLSGTICPTLSCVLRGGTSPNYYFLAVSG